MKQSIIAVIQHNGANPKKTKISFPVICFLLLDFEDTELTFFLEWRETYRLHNELSITSIYITMMRHLILDVLYLTINNLYVV